VNVLILDDVDTNRKLLRAQLEAEGVTVLEASDGVEGLEELKRQKVDAAISDLLMPNMDGYRFCYEVRKSKEHRDLPIIIYTSTYTSPSDEKLSLKLGANKYLRKPASVVQILDALHNATTSKHVIPKSGFDERDVLKHYSERLISKLEEKNVELTRRNRELDQLNNKLEAEILERKSAEERLLEQADIINHARDAIIIRKFEDDQITFWNKGAEHLYGWSVNEALGEPIGKLIYADPKEGEAASRTLIPTGEFRGELRQVTKDGREVLVNGRSTIVRNPDGTPRSVLSINTDVTEQKKLEMRLLRSQRLESIGTLAGGVAHDLNNVLGPILMGAESLRSNPTGEHAAAMISLIEESARRGSSIVKQVLTFARGVEGERVLINPRHLIDEMVEIARKTFPKSIEVTGQYPEHPWSISGDPTQLHQVLLNLSTNARDAMANGGSLVLAAQNLEVDDNYAAMMPGAKAGSYATLRVTDTGVGIPHALVEKIFEPFFTTKDPGKGTGLGLSTSLGIVKSHAGFISVYSEQGRGTTFKVFLPAVQADVAAPQKEIPRAIKGNGELVLLVDDETNIRRVAKMTLEKHNYRVLEANDGPEALAIFAQEMDSVSVVLTDMRMPYIDGIALIRALKKMKPDMIFIGSTGQEDEPRLAELQELGVVNFLSKPYDTRKLLTVLESAVLKELAPLQKKMPPGAQDQNVAHSVAP
jgi:two-component system, cell cycle sensor histidine kinase and response regulator CckA